MKFLFKDCLCVCHAQFIRDEIWKSLLTVSKCSVFAKISQTNKSRWNIVR